MFESTTDKKKEEEGEPAAQSCQSVGLPTAGGLLSALFRLRAFDALRHREFRLLWFGHACAAMATWMDQVARGWLVYELTNSPVQLGLVRGVQAIPMLFLSPVAGSTADRYSRKMQVIMAQVMEGVMYGAIALLVVTGQILPWHVYLTAFGKGIVQTVQHPSRAAMVADAVPSNHLINTIGLNSVIFNVARSTGPALAGVLIAMFGTAGSYSLQALFYVLATIWTIQIRPQQAPSAGSHLHSYKASFGHSIIEGWKFSWRNEAVRTGLLVAMSASLFIVPFTTLLPVFARDLLKVGAEGQGLLLTGMGLGALCSAVLIASAGDRLPRGMLMLGGVTLYGVSVAAFSVSRSFGVSLPLMAMIGLFHVSSHALAQTVVQAYSPSEFRGRTMAVFQMSQVVFMVGSMLVGGLASVLGARWALALMSAVGSLTVIVIYVALPRARLIR